MPIVVIFVRLSYLASVGLSYVSGVGGVDKFLCGKANINAN